jgi:hypothetical protein
VVCLALFQLDSPCLLSSTGAEEAVSGSLLCRIIYHHLSIDEDLACAGHRCAKLVFCCLFWYEGGFECRIPQMIAGKKRVLVVHQQAVGFVDVDLVDLVPVLLGRRVKIDLHRHSILTGLGLGAEGHERKLLPARSTQAVFGRLGLRFDPFQRRHCVVWGKRSGATTTISRDCGIRSNDGGGLLLVKWQNIVRILQ